MTRRTSPWLAPGDPDEGKLWLTWLIRLRWLALFAQAVTFAFVFHLLDGVPALVVWGATMAVLAALNAWTVGRLGQTEEVPAVGVLGQLLTDVAALTAFFAVGGGPDNPFTTLYLVHVAMGAVMLPPRLAAVVGAAVVVGYSALFLGHLPLHVENHSLPAMVLLRLGHWIAFVITATSVAVFVVGIASSLRRRKEQLLEARDRSARTDRLRSVGTLAAGAAHELNTPLSTLSLRLRRVGRRHTDPETTRDVEAMKDQLERCSSIVQRLLVGAGDPSASDMERRELVSMVAEAVRLWSRGSTLEVVLSDESEGFEVELPVVAFQQALINLLENAREAQESVSSFDPLEIRVLREGSDGVVELADHGCGLPRQREQVGEPFFTTKPTGTGLGVFVARAVADGAGGGLQYLPRVPAGTVARWWFPEARRRAV
ncbi:MAG: HAMP domain-containing histidine kinase [Alphaproteobacteria bacterium]|nr:HAMP domain-containing histidine kinase [Alphaproteobacteria bacterium]MCB9699825.1 HAMP domain-containing histidine kinase [Alphaproteobacteria bacterium]